MPTPEPASVQERVREVIRLAGRSQRAFAAEVGLDPTKLSKSLNGSRRFTIEELDRIGEAGGVSVTWLLRGRDDTRVGPAVSAARIDGEGTLLAETGRQREIVDAAWRLIAERGYHSVRVADIARACGTSTAAIHYYFDTRQDLLNAALRHCVAEAFARQGAVLREVDDAHKRLLTLIDLQLPVPEQVVLEWRVWLQFWAETALRPELRTVHEDFYARWRETVERIVRRGVKQGVFRDVDPDETALRFTALTDGLAIQVLTGAQQLPPDMMRRVLVDFVNSELVKQ
ncbi:MAG: TetR family transcriptional regulator [Actinophytocola sp.]|nr:TetR family transcriptional regulator [Actinophytocola sp.]